MFDGNAPVVADDSFASVNYACVAWVSRNSSGWNVDVPGEWNNLYIAYVGEQAPVCFNVINGALRSVTLNGATAIDIPETVKGQEVASIYSAAFRNDTELESVTIPDSVVDIGISAFQGCTALTSVTIPNSVTNIGGAAFSNCSSLREVHISDISAWCGITFGNSYANPLFNAKNLYLDDEPVTDLAIPDGVESIGQYTFCYCTNLTSMTIPASVTSIGQSALATSSKMNVVFMGDVPDFADARAGLLTTCVIWVFSTSTGWGIDIPGRWNGIQINFIDVSNVANRIPTVFDGASPEVIAKLIEKMGYADPGIVDAIGGSATEYNAFAAWANSVRKRGTGGYAGRDQVVANANASVAYRLGTSLLLENVPTISFSGMSIGESGTTGNAMSVAVAVKDGVYPVACSSEKVATLFEATSDLNDWIGDAKLTPEVTFDESGPASTTMRFTVVPGDGTSPRAFLRVKVK